MKKHLLLFLFLILLIALWPVWAQKEAVIQIRVEGLNEPLKGKIVSLLANRSQDISAPVTELKVQRFYRQSPDNIRRGMQAYGYFHPQIHARLEKTGDSWTLVYSISSGPATKIIHVDLQITGEGATDPAFKQLEKNLPVQVGQTLDVDRYQASKDALFSLASNRGYFDAKMVLNQLIINVEHHQTSVVLHFDTGKRYRFGQTLFPPSDLNLNFLERFLRYQSGEYYDSAEVQKTQQVMAGSGFFSQSVLTPLPPHNETLQVPIKVELTPVKPQRYTLGLGYGTDTGPRGTFGFNWIPLNSYGHHLNILARGSYINLGGQTRQSNSINASYIIPGKDPATDSYAITTGYGIINQDTGNANSFKTSLSYNTILSADWQQVLALTYLKERYQIVDIPFTNANVLYPSGHWQYIRNRVIQKEKIIDNGVSATFDIAGASKAFISKTTFVQGKAGFKALGTLQATHTRFLLRSQVGHTVIDNLDNLPLTLQLVTGGATTIRGYKYNSLGPGRNLVLLSGEIQQRVYGNWYGSIFLDTGEVTNSNPLTNFGGGSYKGGAGVGVVVLTPIGAVELAIARPVLNADGAKTWQLAFSVGAEL